MPLMPKGKTTENVERIAEIYKYCWNIKINKSN